MREIKEDRRKRKEKEAKGEIIKDRIKEGNSKNSVALVRKRTIPTERPPPVGEVSANFCG